MLSPVFCEARPTFCYVRMHFEVEHNRLTTTTYRNCCLRRPWILSEQYSEENPVVCLYVIRQPALVWLNGIGLKREVRELSSGIRRVSCCLRECFISSGDLHSVNTQPWTPGSTGVNWFPLAGQALALAGESSQTPSSVNDSFLPLSSIKAVSHPLPSLFITLPPPLTPPLWLYSLFIFSLFPPDTHTLYLCYFSLSLDMLPLD